MRGQPERVAECTSINFDGMIAMLKPDESWVAKWQRISESPSGF
jgi:transcription elongation factor SPT4